MRGAPLANETVVKPLPPARNTLRFFKVFRPFTAVKALYFLISKYSRLTASPIDMTFSCVKIKFSGLVSELKISRLNLDPK